jgi:hypothetical protein
MLSRILWSGLVLGGLHLLVKDGVGRQVQQQSAIRQETQLEARAMGRVVREAALEAFEERAQMIEVVLGSGDIPPPVRRVLEGSQRTLRERSSGSLADASYPQCEVRVDE